MTWRAGSKFGPNHPKDLNDLCELSGAQPRAWRRRRGVGRREPRLRGAPLRRPAEKRAIGAAAATLIPNGCSLFINIGTTTEEVARALASHEGLLVITNNSTWRCILLSPSAHRGHHCRRRRCGAPTAAVVGEAVERPHPASSRSTLPSSAPRRSMRKAPCSISTTARSRRRRPSSPMRANVILVADTQSSQRTAPVRIGHTQPGADLRHRPRPARGPAQQLGRGVRRRRRRGHGQGRSRGDRPGIIPRPLS